MNIYRLRATALCPYQEGRDHYDVEVRSDEMVRVEEILAVMDSYANERISQEALTSQAAATLKAIVNLRGFHPPTVEIESEGGAP